MGNQLSPIISKDLYSRLDLTISQIWEDKHAVEPVYIMSFSPWGHHWAPESVDENTLLKIFLVAHNFADPSWWSCTNQDTWRAPLQIEDTCGVPLHIELSLPMSDMLTINPFLKCKSQFLSDPLYLPSHPNPHPFFFFLTRNQSSKNNNKVK